MKFYGRLDWKIFIREMNDEIRILTILLSKILFLSAPSQIEFLKAQRLSFNLAKDYNLFYGSIVCYSEKHLAQKFIATDASLGFYFNNLADLQFSLLNAWQLNLRTFLLLQ
jgi:hypothetical protein